MKDKSYRFYGILAMGVWILFLVVLLGIDFISNDFHLRVIVDDGIDFFVSILFFIAWLAIWYGIGSHYRKVYLVRKEAFKKMYPDVDEETARKCVLRECVHFML